MIHDIEVTSLDVHATPTGTLVELQRNDWDMFQGADNPDSDAATETTEKPDAIPKMVYAETAVPGTTTDWQRHPDGQVDHLTVPQGQVELAAYDDRPDSESRGETHTVVLGEQEQLLVQIPTGVWHGYRVIGSEAALVLNLPSALYDYYRPDRETVPVESNEIPFEWD